ncbi:MAG: FHA domain-containing protein, partial [Lentisphaeria bacterium]|nr:FHA domain-containing protein [Lentisphaeria bacterium]
MAYLVVESGSSQGQQFEIHNEAVIGRHSSCDIVLTAAGMSRRQCRLFKDGGCYVVEDMNSRNGTFVNGEQVSGTRRLVTNDVVNVSHYMLRFVEHESTTDETTRTSSFIRDDNRRLDRFISMDASYYPGLSGQDEDGDFDPITLDQLVSPEIELQKRLDIFYQVAQALTSAAEDKELLHEVIECLFTVFPQADRAFVMTGQHLDDMQISDVKTRDEKRESIGEITVSRTVLEGVLTKREALLVADMGSDTHYGQAVSIIAQEISSVMCVPMICQDEIFGVVQIENFSISDPFEGK